MRYVIMAVAGVFALVNWLHSPDGTRFKRDFLESRDAHTRFAPEE